MRKMIWVWAILVLLSMTGSAVAQEMSLNKVGFDRIERFVSNHDANRLDLRGIAEDLMEGAFENAPFDFKGILNKVGSNFKQEIIGILKRLAAPVILSMIMQAVLGRDIHITRGIMLFCKALCAVILCGYFVEFRETAENLLSITAEACGVLAPVTISAITLTGASSTASILSPAAALCAEIIEVFFSKLGLALCGCAAAISAADSISDFLSMKKMFSTIKNSLYWMTGIMMTLFMGVLSVQGILGSGYDSAAVRGVRYTVESIVPVIGGEVSDTMDSLVSSALQMKNAIGFSGMIAVIAVVSEPIIKIASGMIAVKLAAAVGEIFADRSLSDGIGQIGDALEMLLVSCVGGVMMVILLLGACLTAAGNIVR